MNTLEIINAICRAEVLKRNFACRNVKYFFERKSFESDVLAFNKSQYITEFEVKVTRGDFLADKKKRRQKYFLQRVKTHVRYLPNYYYYASPPGLIKIEELPEHAGLVWVSESGIEVIKKAPILHKRIWSKERVLEKFMRVSGEREFLGCCLMTHKNRLIDKKNKK